MLALAVAVVSCGGNSSLDNSVATVFLTVDIEENNPGYRRLLPSWAISRSTIDGRSPRIPRTPVGHREQQIRT